MLQGPPVDKLAGTIQSLKTKLDYYDAVRAEYIAAQERADEAAKVAAEKAVACNTAWTSFVEADKAFRAASDDVRGFLTVSEAK
jgi:hypothetical protein